MDQINVLQKSGAKTHPLQVPMEERFEENDKKDLYLQRAGAYFFVGYEKQYIFLSTSCRAIRFIKRVGYVLGNCVRSSI